MADPMKVDIDLSVVYGDTNITQVDNINMSSSNSSNDISLVTSCMEGHNQLIGHEQFTLNEDKGNK